MKVYDIIIEANGVTPIPNSPAGLIMPTGSRTATPTTQSTASTTPAAPANKQKKKKKQKSAAQAKTSSAPPTSNPIKRQYEKISARANKNKLRMQRKEAVYSAKFGWKAKAVFRLLGLTTSIIGFYTILEEIDESWQLGEIETEQDYTNLRDMAYSIFTVQILTPIVVSKIASIVKNIFFIRWIKNGLAVISAPATAGASVVAALATEAGILWFQNWLSSQEGRDWMVKYLFDYIIYFGKVETSLVDFVADKMGKGTALDRAKALPPLDPNDPANKNKGLKGSKKIGPGGTSQGQGGSEKEAPPPAGGASYDTDIRYTRGKNVYVGNVMVTDAEGYLMPATADYIPVQVARSTAIRRGQPDPFDGIPQRPGKPVEILKKLDKPVVQPVDPRPDK